jgi:hypothetical protein
MPDGHWGVVTSKRIEMGVTDVGLGGERRAQIGVTGLTGRDGAFALRQYARFWEAAVPCGNRCSSGDPFAGSQILRMKAR